MITYVYTPIPIKSGSLRVRPTQSRGARAPSEAAWRVAKLEK
jgi:hypothetical protein